jgi:hypothetical protein
MGYCISWVSPPVSGLAIFFSSRDVITFLWSCSGPLPALFFLLLVCFLLVWLLSSVVWQHETALCAFSRLLSLVFHDSRRSDPPCAGLANANPPQEQQKHGEHSTREATEQEGDRGQSSLSEGLFGAAQDA